MTGLKRCPYCCRSHDRRARCCSDWCERKMRGRAAYVTRSRREAGAKLMAAIQKARRFVPQWRAAAMGEEPDLLTIFGTEPHPDPPRHGETLEI